MKRGQYARKSRRGDARWAVAWFSRLYPYARENFRLQRHNCSLWDTWPDRKATFVADWCRIENFHHPTTIQIEGSPES
jgi:hypothetical protein